MTRALRIVTVMAAMGLALAIAAAVALFALGDDTLARAVVSVNGEQVTVGHMQGSLALAAALVILLVIVVVLVVPFAVLLPIVATALALLLALLAVAGTAALVLSPFILLGWAIWHLARPRPPAPAPAPAVPR
jgi:hypothetical protein